MPYNGSGTYTRPAGQPVVAGTDILDTTFNTYTADVAAALTNCITRDGQSSATANLPIGGFKLTGLAAGTGAGDSVRYEQVIGVYAALAGSAIAQDFRLTLTTATPVTTTDVAVATTIYMTPYKGNRIGLWDGTAWINQSSAEISLALGTLTANLPYDVFCYNNAGTATLEFLAWTSIAARATALAYQDGILIKSGDATRRYIGTFYTISTTQTCDVGLQTSVATGRYLFNYYNRVSRPMVGLYSNGTWTYTTATWRQSNNSNANQLNFLIGVAEELVTASLLSAGYNSVQGTAFLAGIGLNSTSVPYTMATRPYKDQTVASSWEQRQANLSGYAALGLNYVAGLEISSAVGTTTWGGSDISALADNCGLTGSIML